MVVKVLERFTRGGRRCASLSVASPCLSWTRQLWTRTPRRTSPCTTLPRLPLVNGKWRHILFFSFLFYITWWEHVLWLQEHTIFDGSCITSSHMKIIYTIISLLYFNVSLSVCVRNQVITLKITLSFNLYLTCWASVSVEHRCLGKCSVFFFF